MFFNLISWNVEQVFFFISVWFITPTVLYLHTHTHTHTPTHSCTDIQTHRSLTQHGKKKSSPTLFLSRLEWHEPSHGGHICSLPPWLIICYHRAETTNAPLMAIILLSAVAHCGWRADTQSHLACRAEIPQPQLNWILKCGMRVCVCVCVCVLVCGCVHICIGSPAYLSVFSYGVHVRSILTHKTWLSGGNLTNSPSPRERKGNSLDL